MAKGNGGGGGGVGAADGGEGFRQQAAELRAQFYEDVKLNNAENMKNTLLREAARVASAASGR